MDYLENYNKIIDYRKQNPLPRTEYGERHHIKPKSICPELAKDKNNQIRLTAYEHFMAHYYLMGHYFQIGEVSSYGKMLCAVTRMSKQCAKHMSNEEAKRFAMIYEKIKIQLANFNSQRCKGRSISEEQKNQISKTLKGHSVSSETRKKLSIAHKKLPSPMKGKHWTLEQKHKMSLIKKGQKSPMQGRHWTQEQKDNMSNARKGVKRKPLSVEHRKKSSVALMGHRVSEETKQKCSISHLGQIPINKGKKMSNEVRKKQSEARKRYYVTHTPWNKGKPCSQETRAKISATKKNKNANLIKAKESAVYVQGTLF